MKKSVIFILFFWTYVDARQVDDCEKLLLFGGVSASIVRNEESSLLHKFGKHKNSWEALNTLGEEVRATEVRFHTSRSPIKASAEFPRKVYLDDSNPQQQFVYAFSMRPGADPVLEIQSFDVVKKTTSFFVTTWSESGELTLTKDPPKCLACHSGGRPLFSGMPSTDHWPFTFSEDMPNTRIMEMKLSKLNIEMQMALVRKRSFESKSVQLLKSAFYDTDESFERKFARSKSQHQNYELQDYYYSQREMFLQMMTAMPPFGKSWLTENDREQLRLYRVLEIEKLDRLQDLLSLQIRPGNFELGTGAREALKNWVDGL